MSNVKTVKSAYEAFGKGDIPTVLDMMDAKIEWREAEGHPYMPSGEPWVGPESVMENLFQRLGADWASFTVTPKSFHDAGDTVVVEGRYDGKHGGTGKTLDAQFCHVWTLQNGKLARFQQYSDTAQIQETMGARVEG